MSNDQQIAANRLNAQRSTGPRTPAGKTKVSANALKHGLTGRDVVLPSENPDDFESFRAELLISLDPHDALEGALAENFVACLWRLRRVSVFEARLYRRGAAQLLASQAAKEDRVREYQLTEDHELTEASILAALKKKKLGIWYGRFEDAEQRRARDQAELDDHATRMLENYPQPFLNLWRHEAALSRSLQKTLHDLERLQARRAGEHVPAPVVVDVDVSHGEPPRADIGGTVPSGEADGHQQ